MRNCAANASFGVPDPRKLYTITGVVFSTCVPPSVANPSSIREVKHIDSGARHNVPNLG